MTKANDENVLDEHPLPKRIAVLGMQKDKRHRTSALAFEDGRLLSLVNEDNQEILQREEQRALLRLITAIQDEAHRFALTYTRKMSRKRNTKFSLESIKGVGPSRRKALLEAFGSIRAIKEAKIPDLLKVAGMNEVAAESVYRHFHC
jgi:excinuclease ABC subunit C